MANLLLRTVAEALSDHREFILSRIEIYDNNLYINYQGDRVYVGQENAFDMHHNVYRIVCSNTYQVKLVSINHPDLINEIIRAIQFVTIK